MKIYLSNKREIYDTEQPEKVDFRRVDTLHLKPLHHSHAMTDWEYLQKYFQVGHRIFNGFTENYYYLMQS